MAITIDDKRERRDRLFMLFLLFIPCLFIKLEFDSDTYWLINSGRFVLDHGIPHIEPFTLHQGLHFVMQQWMSATLFAVIYDVLGSSFLFVLVALAYGSIIYSVYRLCMRVSDGNFLVSFTITMFVSIPLNFFMVLRPYLFSLLLLTVELNLLEAYLQTKKKAFLWCLPILSVLLVNLHAAMWPFLFVLLIPYIIDSFEFKLGVVKGEGYPRLQLCFAALGSVIAGFINPYGWEAMTYLFRSYGNQYVSAMISEMQSPDFKSVFGILVFLIYVIPILLYIVNRKGEGRLRYALLTIGTGFLGLSSIRSLSMFLVCGIPFLANTLKSAQIIPKNSAKAKASPMRYVLAGLLVLLLSTFFFLRAANSEKEAQLFLPIQAVDYIKTNLDGESIRLYTGYNIGGYAEFEGLHPFMDARAEVFFKSNNKKEDFIDDYFHVQLGKSHYREIIDKYQLTHFLVDQTDLLFTYLPQDPDFELLYEDGEFKVFALKSPN